MEIEELRKEFEALALGPLDGRYAEIAKKLAPYFSEYALVKNRVLVEIKWLVFFVKNILKEKLKEDVINHIYEEFDMNSYKRVKQIEEITKHDVKAVEIFVGEKLKENQLEDLVSFVHIGCTSEDINNCARGIMVKQAIEDVWYPVANELISILSKIADDYKNTPMLAHTHGQPATPTTIGKEFAVYVYRLKQSIENIKGVKHTAKFNGATGNYAAISIAYSNENWIELMKKFVEEELGLEFNPATTQIESHDNVAHLCDGIRHFNNVLLDLDLDMWTYISMEYFKQVAVKTEVGSSTMPHKVNPIKFENSEANIDMANAILMALSNKLTHSRMQRDLSDSSSQRNIGLAFGYSIQAIEQTILGLNRVEVNKEKLEKELNEKWEILAEPIQTILRKYKIQNAYDKLKELTRGKTIKKEDIQNFIENIDEISNEDKKALLELTPNKYIGYSEEIVKEILK